MAVTPAALRLPQHDSFIQALSASVPVFFGYMPMGAAFGILLVNAGVPWHAAIAMSMLVFAGSAQYLAVGMLGAGLGLVEIGIATFAINLRHAFYGLSFLERYRVSGWKKCYLVFGLTDETYAILTSTRGEKDDIHYCLWLTALNQSYWVLGSAVGAILGSQFNIQVEGLSFALTAMFAVLLVEKWFTTRRIAPFAVGIVAAILGKLFVPDRMLLPAIAFAVIYLLASSRFRAADKP